MIPVIVILIVVLAIVFWCIKQSMDSRKKRSVCRRDSPA